MSQGYDVAGRGEMPLVEVEVIPGAPGQLDALQRELGPEVGIVVDPAGRVLGLVRWGVDGLEACDA